MHLRCSALHLILFQLFLKLFRAHTMQSARSKAGGYIIFIRHGHRAPGRNIMLEADSLAEVKLWKSHVFNSDPQKNSTIAVKQHPVNGLARDLATRPFGCITTKGREHLQTIGRNISAYFPDLKNVKNENLLIYSTNYQRTQASAQMLLSGLFASNTVRDMTSVHVQVRDMKECAMSFYDGFPLTAKKFFAKAQSTEEFKERENRKEIVQTREDLAKNIPGLLLKGSSQNPTFDWLGAFDYYACREAHNLPLIPGTEPYSTVVRRHLSARYGDYYRDPVHLAHTAVPLLLDLERAVRSVSPSPSIPLSVSGSGQSTHSSFTAIDGITFKTSDITQDKGIGSGTGRERGQGGSSGEGGIRVTVFSGHDITVLTLLFALKADLVMTPQDGYFWPDYGSSMVFEVKEGKEGDEENTLITAYLDLAPLSVDMKSVPSSSLSSSPSTSPSSFSFSLSELIERIDSLAVNLTPMEG